MQTPTFTLLIATFILFFNPLITSHPLNATLDRRAPPKTIEVTFYTNFGCMGHVTRYTIGAYFTQLILPPTGAFAISRDLEDGEMVDFSTTGCKKWVSSFQKQGSFFPPQGKGDNGRRLGGAQQSQCISVDEAGTKGIAGCVELKKYG